MNVNCYALSCLVSAFIITCAGLSEFNAAESIGGEVDLSQTFGNKGYYQQVQFPPSSQPPSSQPPSPGQLPPGPVSSPGQYVPYEFPWLGMRIQYPGAWQVGQYGQNFVIVVSSYPQITSGIVVFPLPNPSMSFQEVVEAFSSPQFLGDGTLGVSREFTLSGNIAHLLVIGYPQAERVQILSLYGDRIYSLNFLASPSDLENNFDSINQVIGSFQFTGQQGFGQPAPGPYPAPAPGPYPAPAPGPYPAPAPGPYPAPAPGPYPAPAPGPYPAPAPGPYPAPAPGPYPAPAPGPYPAPAPGPYPAPAPGPYPAPAPGPYPAPAPGPYPSPYPGSFMTHENRNAGIILTHPSDWQVHDYEDAVDVLSPPQGNMAYQDFVYVANLGDSANFPQLGEMVSNVIEKKKQDYPDFQIIASEPQNLMGYPAYVLEYAYSDPNTRVPLRAVDIPIVSQGKLFLYVFKADSGQFSSYAPISQGILGSLQFSPGSNFNQASDSQAMYTEMQEPKS